MATSRVRALDGKALTQAAEWLAVAVAVSLPWSTTATGILIAFWLVAVLPTLDAGAIRRALMSPAGGLPVLLWALAVAGLLWADVSWRERFAGLSGFHRLLVIPLLLAQFQRSTHGMRVFQGFFISASSVLLVSWALALIPGLSWRGTAFGVPVKDYVFQSEDFLICAFALLGLAFDKVRSRHWRSIAALVAVAALFLANIAYVATARTTLLVAPVLLLLLGWRLCGWKGLLAAVLFGCLTATAVSIESPYLHGRLTNSIKEFQAYRATDALNSTALHLEFLQKSLTFVKSAPVIGHGTGSIAEEFRNAALGQTGAAAVPSVNPHNQIFAVGIQLGIIGIAVLLAMWAAHLLLFRGGGFVAWIGLIVVVQNVVASLFNTHLFDFTQGWLYVFGVGVAGGMMLQKRDVTPAAGP
jgi:hypothetical protein